MWREPGGSPNVYSGPYDYARNGACENRGNLPQRFRIKFGIYRAGEDGSRYEVDYDDIRVGAATSEL